MTQAPKTSRPIPLLDVQRGNAPLRQELLDSLSRVLDSGRFLHGPEVTDLENRIAKLSGVRHAIGCASGSDALLLALMALEIGAGDEVILPSFTFFATASCVWRQGATIVFADLDPNTYNIDPQGLEGLITPRTKAIIPVHLFGQCAAMDAIRRIAQKHSLAVIEDVAQAIGAAYQGIPAGGWGKVGCLSFYPTKNLGGMGDGGMLTCQDDALAARLRLFAAHGMQPRYHHQVVGINSRLDTMQAAVLGVKLNHLESYTQARRQNAARYLEMFGGKAIGAIQLPYEDPSVHHVWNQFGIRVLDGQRDALKQYLTEQGIGSEIYYPIPLHQQPCFASLGYAPGSLPETEAAAAQILHLPIYPELQVEEQHRVVHAITHFFRTAQYRRAA
jgi:dTDP-4-amino-4,6-dideoxygalactose transaminase